MTRERALKMADASTRPSDLPDLVDAFTDAGDLLMAIMKRGVTNPENAARLLAFAAEYRGIARVYSP